MGQSMPKATSRVGVGKTFLRENGKRLNQLWIWLNKLLLLLRPDPAHPGTQPLATQTCQRLPHCTIFLASCLYYACSTNSWGPSKLSASEASHSLWCSIINRAIYIYGRCPTVRTKCKLLFLQTQTLLADYSTNACHTSPLTFNDS